MPLLGVVPDEPYLARPSLIDLEKIFKTKLLAGLENRRQPHYSIKHTHLAATGAFVRLDAGDPSSPRHRFVQAHTNAWWLSVSEVIHTK